MESFPNQESVSREVLVESLKNKGIDDVETRGMLIAWAEAKEREVEREGTREAQVGFEVERAELYLDAGFVDEARQAFEDAFMIAIQEGLDEMSQRIEQRLSELS